MMTPQAGSPAYPVRKFSIEQAEREYFRKRQGTALETQSASPSFDSSLPPLLLRAYSLDGRSADYWRQLQVTGDFTERREWFNTALRELSDIDTEVAEESLPEILTGTKDHAKRIIVALATQSIAPTVYPTEDGEIALYFKSPIAKSSVLILVGNDGQGACFSHIKGKNRRARYDDASELPDVFVKAQLQRLSDG